ncbi:MAG: CvpA family protein [Alistipes sp.]|jgi:membrane protein required for colicin V production|nr:CvpA family protein [Alistipes sp.]
MNYLDIVIILLLLFAAWEGWRQGVVTQILGLVALALGIWLAWRHGSPIGQWLGMEGTTASVVGFAVVLVAVIVVVVLIGRVTRGLFHIVGLGVFDNFLGVLFAALKIVVFTGLLLTLFDVLDPEGGVISHEVRDGSVMYGVVERVNDALFPFVRDIFRQL